MAPACDPARASRAVRSSGLTGCMEFTLRVGGSPHRGPPCTCGWEPAVDADRDRPGLPGTDSECGAGRHNCYPILGFRSRGVGGGTIGGSPYPRARGGRSYRHLRLRVRGPHRRPRSARPAAARAGALLRRHRAPALRTAADRRGPGVRSRVPRPPGRAGCEDAGHRLQQRQRRGPARRPRALRGPGGRGDQARRTPGGGRDPQRPRRGHLDRRHQDQPGLRGRSRGRPAHRGHDPGLPAVRRVRRAGRDGWPGAARRRPRVPRPGRRGPASTR